LQASSHHVWITVATLQASRACLVDASDTGQADGVTGRADGVTGRADGVTGQADRVTGQADGVAGQADGVTGQAIGVTGQPDGVTGQADGVRPGGERHDTKEDVRERVAETVSKVVSPKRHRCLSVDEDSDALSSELLPFPASVVCSALSMSSIKTGRGAFFV